MFTKLICRKIYCRIQDLRALNVCEYVYIWLHVGSVAGPCQQGAKYSVSIKGIIHFHY